MTCSRQLIKPTSQDYSKSEIRKPLVMSGELSESRGCVTCLLCNATISVRIGNYGKLKLHMETNHDVFYEQDLIMALNFLEDHEREVIIEKVLPRMDLCLNKAKAIDKKDGLKLKLDIEKRLFSDEDKDVVEERIRSDRNKDQETLENDRIDFEDVVEDEGQLESPVKKMRLDESSPIEESLEISLDESDDVLIDGDSQRNDEPPQMLGKDEVECGLCRNVFKKRSMYNHRRRCELREKIRKMGEENRKARMEAESVENNESNHESEISEEDQDGPEEDSEQEHEVRSNRRSYNCEPCNTTYSSSGNLARHRRQKHS